MSKYIIKNCPAFDEGDCASPTEHIPYATACEHIEDCEMKQIVELCKERTVGFIEEGLIKDNILQLLDIQEVE